MAKARSVFAGAGLVALALALVGLFMTLGSGVRADPDRKPASQDDSQGLQSERLGF